MYDHNYFLLQCVDMNVNNSAETFLYLCVFDDSE